MDFQDLSDTKSLSTFSIQLHPSFILHLSQQNNTQNHGTTVWDSAKLLAFYLFDTLKRPPLNNNQKVEKRSCLELGSGCGLVGLTMASLGFESVLTDLPEVIEQVLQPNCNIAMENINDWWCQLYPDTTLEPRVSVRSLNWLQQPEETAIEPSSSNYFSYILASDCIYEIELVEPLLNCIRRHASPQTSILIAMERRDDAVIDGFIEKAKLLGFETRMILKKLLKSQIVNNEDVEIWKLKLKKNRTAGRR
ncbi:MAG: putative methyltransferase-domain-containing protein [Benjaminiella poitrasii]|nr:MAG: putative methyltransferase-domain-containing protein [Benjaminiella poitrasii]